MAQFNLARMTVSSTGTGTITLNAAVSGFLTFDAAGCSTAATGQAVTYAIGDTTQSEIGYGTYYSSALSLTRGPVQSTNSNNAIAMSNAAQVIITPQAKGIIGRLNIQTFTANGTYTPTTGLISAVIECVGGGGGGGGVDGDVGFIAAGGGGGSGGYSRTVSPSSVIGTSQTVTVGSGGAGGAAGSNSGSAGNDTSVGALCIGKGGSGGHFGANLTQPTGGAGGVAGTGTITQPGQPGVYGYYMATTATALFAPTGAGGNSHFGPGAAAGSFGIGVTPVTGVNATSNTGGGGSGGGVYDETNTAAGGNGGSGIAIITEFCSL